MSSEEIIVKQKEERERRQKVDNLIIKVPVMEEEIIDLDSRTTVVEQEIQTKKLSELADVQISSAATNDFLVWNGTSWMNQASSEQVHSTPFLVTAPSGTGDIKLCDYPTGLLVSKVVGVLGALRSTSVTLYKGLDGIYMNTSSSIGGQYVGGVILSINDEIPAPLPLGILTSSINADGTPYNGGLGYKDGYRIKSDGTEASTTANVACTGFIRVYKDHNYSYTNINIAANNSFPEYTSSSYNVVFYDSSFNILYAGSQYSLFNRPNNNCVLDDSGNYIRSMDYIYFGSHVDMDALAYVRFTIVKTGAPEMYDNTI